MHQVIFYIYIITFVSPILLTFPLAKSSLPKSMTNPSLLCDCPLGTATPNFVCVFLHILDSVVTQFLIIIFLAKTSVVIDAKVGEI